MAASRRQVRHRDQPFLLGRRHSGDGVRRRLHDAVLLRLQARSVPEYLKLRFDEKTRGFNASTFAMMTMFSSGISHVCDGRCCLIRSLLGWNFHACDLSRPSIVLVYIFLGGLTCAIYNEVLQFFLIVSRLRAAGLSRAARRRRLGGAAAALRRRPETLPRTLDQSWATWDAAPTRWASSGSAWSWGWVRALVRLLVHRLPGRPAGDGRRSMSAARRTPLIAASEDVLPVPGHPARA